MLLRKKLREARFFLSKMAERERLAFGDRDEFGFYLSAFLNATKTVDYRLHHEQGTAYHSFRKNWIGSLSGADQRLLRFMVDDRNLEVHESGSGRGEEERRIPVFGHYGDASGKVIVFGPPGTPPAQIVKPTYIFVIDGHRRSVLQCCDDYTRLIARMIDEYCQTQGIT